ncbi:MAG TPA: HAMP domain-containing sensor histidine kinase [Acidimicrobiales bacterium]|nr:HAMP domain-containing sensor histidine kinase [Acidimicrobiales bacterium]
MRARITLTLFALVAAALFLAGSVSLLLVRHAQSASAQTALENEALTLAANPTLVSKSTLPTLTKLLGLASGGKILVDSVTVDRDGVLLPAPPGVPIDRAQGRALFAGQSIKTSRNHLAFAAARLTTISTGRARITVALYLESRLNFATDNGWYFLTAGGVALLVAAAVAAVISQRISRRVGAVAVAARNIAAGDLATRVRPLGDRTYPELRELDASINTMAANLERAQQAERDFLLAISHEFRTPLTSIRGYAEAISEGAVEDTTRAASVVVAEADRLEHLIGDLLDLARLRARQFALDIGEIDVVAVASQGAAAMRFAFTAEGLELAVEVPDERLMVRADYHRLAQVVANLLENAQRFARTRVSILVERDNEHVLVAVRDDGRGIDSEDLPHIFERLFKSDRHPGRTSGSGLGLAIVAELAAAMDATVTAHSPLGPDGGTEMRIVFHLDSVEADGGG